MKSYSEIFILVLKVNVIHNTRDSYSVRRGWLPGFFVKKLPDIEDVRDKKSIQRTVIQQEIVASLNLITQKVNKNLKIVNYFPSVFDSLF